MRRQEKIEPLCVLFDYDFNIHGDYRQLSWTYLEHTFCKDDDDENAGRLAKPALEGSFEKLNAIKQIWNFGNNLTPDQL